MRRAVRIAFGAVAIVAIALLTTVMIARYVFDRRVDGEVSDLFEQAAAAEPSVLTEADIAHLPEPVQRWIRYSGAIDKPRPLSVRLKQEGEIRLKPDAEYMPFTATQYYTTDPPAFIWKADVQMMPLISFSGRDKYEGGHGNMEIRVMSLIPVVNATGPEMDQGTLLRYLNETMWFPAGAVSPYITWESVDDNSARATMSYEGVEASATFFFDTEGRVTTMVANRYQDAGGGEFKYLPWKTPVSDYGEFAGLRIPVAGAGVWEEEWGDFTYVRLRIVDLEYNVPELYEG